MPPKKSDATAGMKLLGLYWLLLFTGRAYSLPDLAARLKCSKPAVLRLMDQIEVSGWADVETWIDERDRKRWYKLRAPRQRPQVSLDLEDIQGLLLCRDMVWHFLPPSLRQNVSKAIGHATVLMPDPSQRKLATSGLAGTRTKGGVDYSGKGELVADLLKAMRAGKVCRVVYRRPGAKKDKHYYWAPFRLLAHRDALYALGWHLWEDAVPPEVHEITLALHRIKELVVTARGYKNKASHNCAEEPVAFGLIEGEQFRVRVAFSPGAACYVSERVWSQDQKLEPHPDGGLTLEFSSTSWPEVVSLVLSFGDQAKALDPPKLADDVRQTLERALAIYSIPESRPTKS